MTSNAPKKRARGRPKQSEGPVVTREKLLEIAAKMVGEKGFDRMSIRGLASAAGVSNRSVQHHFQAKDDIWRALVDDVILPELAYKIEDAVSEVPSSEDALVALIEREISVRIDRALTRPGLSAAMLTDPSEGARERLEYVAAATSELRRENLLTIASSMDSGLMRAIDPRTLAIVISVGLACISSAKNATDVLYDVDLDDKQARDTLTEEITELLLYGLLPRAGD